MHTVRRQRLGLREFRLLTSKALLFVAAIVPATIALSACSSPELIPSNADPAFASVYEQAKDNGADDGQLDILRRSSVAGEVTYQDVTEALSASFECFDKAGVGHVDEGVVVLESGLPFPGYGWGGGITDEEVERLSAVGDAG